MTNIRDQLRFTFASTIALLLVVCSVTIWFWARYLVSRQIHALLSHDIDRLANAIAWEPDLSAFELRPSAEMIHELTSDYWQISDPGGAVIWKSDTWKGDVVPPAEHSKVFSVRTPDVRGTLYAMQRAIRRPRIAENRTMLSDFPEPVMHTVHQNFPNTEILATELEFADDRLIYEITTRKGDDLLEVEMDADGQIIEQMQHHVPHTLPAAVSKALQASDAGAIVQSFDWRASQGRLQFIINAVTPDQRAIKRCIDSTGRAVRVFFPTNDELPFQLLVADEQLWGRALLRKLSVLLTSVCGTGLLATLLIAVWLTRRTLLPIAAIARKASQIDDRRLSERLTGGRAGDEIGLLVKAINDMLDRIENAFERQRRFARDASHELRGPLTGLIAQLELVRNALAADHPASEHTHSALERGRRLCDLVEKLLLLARQDSDQPLNMRDDLDIRECLAHVVADFTDDQKKRIHLQAPDETTQEPRTKDRSEPLARSETAFVQGNEELLHAMFRNIIENALKFSPAVTPVRVEIGRHNGNIDVAVLDDGPGIPDAAREHIFQPFVRLRAGENQTTQGSGLGLSIVQWIATLHHAEIHIEAGPNASGTRLSISIPEAS